MRRDQLAHLLRAASEIVGERDVVVIGSQSILASYTESELPEPVVGSIEADLTFLDDPDNAKSDKVDAAIGEDSQFHATFGYYGQSVSVTTAKLPAGWRDRVVVLDDQSARPGRGLCLDPHDLVVSKLAAGREKDFAFAWALLRAGLVDPHTLAERARHLEAATSIQRRVLAWVHASAQRLGGDGGPNR